VERPGKALGPHPLVEAVGVVEGRGADGDDRIDGRTASVVRLDAGEIELGELSTGDLAGEVGAMYGGDGGVEQLELVFGQCVSVVAIEST